MLCTYEERGLPCFFGADVFVKERRRWVRERLIGSVCCGLLCGGDGDENIVYMDHPNIYNWAAWGLEY